MSIGTWAGTAMATVVITGASGNLGQKLRQAFGARFTLRLLDREPGEDSSVLRCDLSEWGEWVEQLRGADAVVHLAANARATATWEELLAPNLDAAMNVFRASVEAGVRRVVFASSNHVMGGYQGQCGPGELTTELVPRPGTRYLVEGVECDSAPYGASKLFGERLGRWYAERFGLDVVCVRIGWVRPGDNRPEDVPRREWFRAMWLSTGDFCQVIERSLFCALENRFEVVNAMSDNAGMAWDIAGTRRVLGYSPRDGLDR